MQYGITRPQFIQTYAPVYLINYPLKNNRDCVIQAQWYAFVETFCYTILIDGVNNLVYIGHLISVHSDQSQVQICTLFYRELL